MAQNLSVENRFSNKYFDMWIEDDLLHITYLDNVIVDLEAARIILRDRLAFQKGRSFATFVDVRKVEYWTKEARAYQGTEQNHEGIKAFAMLIDSPIQKTVIKFYLYFNKPKTPTDCFLSKEKCLDWLSQYQ